MSLWILKQFLFPICHQNKGRVLYRDQQSRMMYFLPVARLFLDVLFLERDDCFTLLFFAGEMHDYNEKDENRFIHDFDLAR